MSGGPLTSKSSAKRLLLVDDEAFFREALQTVLKQSGFEVTTAPHAKVAQDLLGIGSFDVVVSDINMPGISGIELLKFVRNTKPDLPVILMTGFAELKETVEADSLGAKGFLAKPFKKEDSLGLLENLLVPTGATEKIETNQDLNFCKLSIDDFISGHQIKFDIYVRLSGAK